MHKPRKIFKSSNHRHNRKFPYPIDDDEVILNPFDGYREGRLTIKLSDGKSINSYLKGE